MDKKKIDKVIKSLRLGQIGVLPTDTLYGLVGQALNQETVERIYQTKNRQPDKPFIILISSATDLKTFGIKINSATQNFLSTVWPGPTSIILPVNQKGLVKKFSYLHRGTGFLAFRLPKNKILREIIKKTGPLVAPSANPEGQKPAQTTTEAKKYFGQQVDFFLSIGKKLAGQPSRLIKVENGQIIEILR